MIITALDMSLTATGWARSDGTSGVIVPPKGHDRGIPRLRWLRNAVNGIVRDNTVQNIVHNLGEQTDLVVIEGYAFGVQGQQGHISLGELGGVVRVMLADLNIAFVEIPPSCVKLFATGKGNAPKDEVLAAAIRKLTYRGHDHNEADALWLLEMACAHYIARNDFLLNEAQQRALAKIAWPKLAGLAPVGTSSEQLPAALSSSSFR